MSTIKEGLRLRNMHIHYVRNYMFNTMRIPSGLKDEIDSVIHEGVLLISEIDLMFWTDTDFLDIIVRYMYDGERVIKKLADETEFTYASEFLFSMEKQTEMFLKIIDEQTSNPENKKVTLTTRRFPAFLTTIDNPGFN